MISSIRVGSPQFMYMYEQEQAQKHQRDIEMAIVDIRTGPHTQNCIDAVLARYGLNATNLTSEEIAYMQRMINS